MTDNTSRTRQSYDRVADEYSRRFFTELDHKPLDRAMLSYFADLTRDRGPVADIGCGTGQIARFLHDSGQDAIGIDLSPEMIAVARRLSPEVRFEEGSMLDLPLPDASLGGITAFYSIIHLPLDDLSRAFGEFRRVLGPGGAALLSFHLGDECVHRDAWWGFEVDLDFHFFTREAVERALRAAGFGVEAYLERQPYLPLEHPSTRAYLLARNPTSDQR